MTVFSGVDGGPTQDDRARHSERPRAEHGVLFGELALTERYVTPEQLNDAVLAQRRTTRRTAKKIGNIMIRKGYLSIEQAKYLLRLQRLNDPIEGYKLLAKIGKGGMGVVYKAWQKSMKRQVALKILSPRFSKSRTFKERFFREARLAGRLNHPNIIAGYDVGESNGHYFFAMELVEGKTLKALMQEEGVFGPERAAELMLQVARAMEHYDQFAIIHRDIKPDNVILTSDGVAKLGDLGLSKQLTSNCHITRYGKTLGTPYYISPELAVGQTMTDIRSDIYSLGATFYSLLVGEPPFVGKSPTEIMARHVRETPVPVHQRRPEVPARLSRILESMMAKPISNRMANPTALIESLEHFLDLTGSDELSIADSVELVRERRRPGRVAEHRARAGISVARYAVICAVFLLSLAGVAYIAWRGPSVESHRKLGEAERLVSERANYLRAAIDAFEALADDPYVGEKARERSAALASAWEQRAESEFSRTRRLVLELAEQSQFRRSRRELRAFVARFRKTRCVAERLPSLLKALDEESEQQFVGTRRAVHQLFSAGRYETAASELERSRDLTAAPVNIERELLLLEAARLE